MSMKTNLLKKLRALIIWLLVVGPGWELESGAAEALTDQTGDS